MASEARGGEISGLPAHLVPTVVADYAYFFGNDFAAARTSDDYRTEQMIVSGRFRKSWIAVVDHSILTREDVPEDKRARIDTMTMSLGYEFLRADGGTQRTTVAAGAAVRATGNFQGERIQNGFHRLVNSDTEFIPYTDTRETDLAAWVLAEHYREFAAVPRDSFAGSWTTGMWLRAGAFVSGGGQRDAVAGVYAVASRGAIDFWLGARRDWRSGYDADFVLRETAHEEDKYAVSFGARIGSLVIETVQRIDSAASYGQLSFISSPETRRNTHMARARVDGQLSLQIPQITFQLAARRHHRLLTSERSRWQEAIFAEVRSGQPQLGHNPTLFVDTTQASLGIEWSRPVVHSTHWLRFYTNIGAGWRQERLLGDGERRGESSDAVDRAVLVAEGGIEIDATALTEHLDLRLRLGVTGWLPTSDAVVDVGNTTEVVQGPDASILAGWVLAWH